MSLTNDHKMNYYISTIQIILPIILYHHPQPPLYSYLLRLVSLWLYGRIKLKFTNDHDIATRTGIRVIWDRYNKTATNFLVSS